MVVPTATGEATLQRQRRLVLPNGAVATNRLASVLSNSLATREDLFSRSPFRASVRIAVYNRPIL